MPAGTPENNFLLSLSVDGDATQLFTGYKDPSFQRRLARLKS
jgi:hypothetical protein